MIKSVLLLFVTLVSSSYLNFYAKEKDVNLKLEEFNLLVENNLDFVIDDKVYLVFDYSNIEKEILNLFGDYDYVIKKNSSSSFLIVITIETIFIRKEIKEEYYLKKGDLYEGIN